jgi:hypothetical protein
MTESIVFDAKGLLKDLTALEPGLKKELKAEARSESEEAQTAIRDAIPSVAPLSGMDIIRNPSGRLAWGAGKPANKVDFSISSKRSKNYAVTSLFRLIVASPMSAIADTAGKGSGVPRNLRTKPYSYKGETRTHKVNGQGEAMILNLKKRRGSNFVYPAVESSLPGVQAKVKLVVEKYAAKVNRKLN